MKLPKVSLEVLSHLNHLSNYSIEDARALTLVQAETVQEWMMSHMKGINLKFRLMNLSADSVKHSRFLNMNPDIIQLLMDENNSDVNAFIEEGVEAILNNLRGSMAVFSTLNATSGGTISGLEKQLEAALAKALAGKNDDHFDNFGALIDNMTTVSPTDPGYLKLQKYLGGAGNRALISAILSLVAQARFLTASNSSLQAWLNGNLPVTDSFDIMVRKAHTINSSFLSSSLELWRDEVFSMVNSSPTMKLLMSTVYAAEDVNKNRVMTMSPNLIKTLASTAKFDPMYEYQGNFIRTVALSDKKIFQRLKEHAGVFVYETSVINDKIVSATFPDYLTIFYLLLAGKPVHEIKEMVTTAITEAATRSITFQQALAELAESDLPISVDAYPTSGEGMLAAVNSLHQRQELYNILLLDDNYIAQQLAPINLLEGNERGSEADKKLVFIVNKAFRLFGLSATYAMRSVIYHIQPLLELMDSVKGHDRYIETLNFSDAMSRANLVKGEDPLLGDYLNFKTIDWNDDVVVNSLMSFGIVSPYKTSRSWKNAFSASLTKIEPLLTSKFVFSAKHLRRLLISQEEFGIAQGTKAKRDTLHGYFNSRELYGVENVIRNSGPALIDRIINDNIDFFGKTEYSLALSNTTYNKPFDLAIYSSNPNTVVEEFDSKVVLNTERTKYTVDVCLGSLDFVARLLRAKRNSFNISLQDIKKMLVPVASQSIYSNQSAVQRIKDPGFLGQPVIMLNRHSDLPLDTQNSFNRGYGLGESKLLPKFLALWLGLTFTELTEHYDSRILGDSIFGSSFSTKSLADRRLMEWAYFHFRTGEHSLDPRDGKIEPITSDIQYDPLLNILTRGVSTKVDDYDKSTVTDLATLRWEDDILEIFQELKNKTGLASEDLWMFVRTDMSLLQMNLNYPTGAALGVAIGYIVPTAVFTSLQVDRQDYLLSSTLKGLGISEQRMAFIGVFGFDTVIADYKDELRRKIFSSEVMYFK